MPIDANPIFQPSCSSLFWPRSTCRFDDRITPIGANIVGRYVAQRQPNVARSLQAAQLALVKSTCLGHVLMGSYYCCIGPGWSRNAPQSMG